MTDLQIFYYREWKTAEKDGNIRYAESCKIAYRNIVIELLKKPYNYFNEKLKQYPIIYIN